jgi:alkylation response protein AidB-like acyl-CoA dehydrogenase
MTIEVEVGCNLGHELSWQATQGQPTVKSSSQIKVHGAAVAQRVANLGMQVLGLYGALHEDSKVVRLGGRFSHEYLSTVASSLAGGTTENSKNHIAGRAGLGLPKK